MRIGIKMIEIKDNLELYEKVHSLAQRIIAWSSYVQGNNNIPKEDIKKIYQMCDSHIQELTQLKTEFFKYFVKCNKGQDG